MNNSKKMETFQELITKLKNYWIKYGCTIVQPFDIEIGAGTAHPITFFNSLGQKSASFAYVQPSRRPSDGRYGKNSNRLQKYYQFQVIIKPSLDNVQDLYLSSLKELGINLNIHDIRFIEDNWESPTLGASGLGWEVWLNGMEITQFTYFQQVAGIDCNPITCEITYGLERLAMYIQNSNDIFSILLSNNIDNKLHYKDIHLENEIQQSKYNFEYANIQFLINVFNEYQKEIIYLLDLKPPLYLTAYEYTLKIIHIFNILESRKSISITERQRYISKIRKLIKKIGKIYISNQNK
ncbi:MAG: glycine--tRNA ligase subunit alpha [Arsenophonus sp.]|nr:MAG: glycine--tRNA ligase subunit alpha [Arsenophonus sp.]